MNTKRYYVPNISCHHCVHTIKTELSDLEGIRTVDANMQTKEVTIQYDHPASPEQIEALMADIHYPVLKNESYTN